jgi:hypothetical protein
VAELTMSGSPREPRRGKAGNAARVDFATVRRLALALPGVEDGISYRTPALRVRGKLLARLKEDGESFVLRVGFDARDILMQADPKTFYITDHYRDYPAVLIRFATVDPSQLPGILEQAWQEIAPKRLVASFRGDHD